MAPKSKIRLVDQPPSASSSDEDEERSEQEEQSEQEVEKSESEYVSESEEENGKEGEKVPSTPILNQGHVYKSQSASGCDEEESEAEYQETLQSPSASDFTIKPIVSYRPPPASPPKAAAPSKSSAKRAWEALEKDSKKRRSKTGEGDGHAEEKKSAASAGSNRLWSDEDQIAILQGMVDYKAQKGTDYYIDMSAFHDFIKDRLHVEVSKTQMTEKIRRLKKKFLNVCEKGDDSILKPHEKMSHELSKQIWGNAASSVNGKNLNANSNQVEVNVKSANGKVKKPAEEETQMKRKKNATKAEETEKKKKKQRIALGVKDKQIVLEKREEKGEQSALEEKDDQTVVEEKDKQIAMNDIVNGEVETEKGDFKSKYPQLADSFSKKNYPLSSQETLDMLKEKLNLIGSSKAEEIEEKWTKLWEEQAELCGKMTDLLAQQIKLVLDAIKR